jgi:hypothetical protein
MCFVAQHVVLRSWSLPHMGVAVAVVVPRGCCSRGVKHTAFVRTWPCLPVHTHVCLVSLGYVLAYCLVSGSAYLAGLPHSLEPLVLSHTSSQTCVVLHYTHFRRLSLQLLSLCLSMGTCVECLRDTACTMLNKHRVLVKTNITSFISSYTFHTQSLPCVWYRSHSHCTTCGLLSLSLRSMWCRGRGCCMVWVLRAGSSRSMGVAVMVVVRCVVPPLPSLHSVWVAVAIFVRHVGCRHCAACGSPLLCSMWVTVIARCVGHCRCVACGSPLLFLHGVWCCNRGRCVAWVS